MIVNSNASKYLLLAIDKGYKINPQGIVTSKTGRIRKLYINKDGYLAFTIKIEPKTNKKGTILAHQLQAYTKFNSNIFGLDIVTRHVDNNKLNNSYDNILIGTTKQNFEDNPVNKGLIPMQKAANKRKLFTPSQIQEIRQGVKKGISQKYFVVKHNCYKSTISNIVNNKLYKRKQNEKY